MTVIEILKNYFIYKECSIETEEYEAALSLELVIQGLVERGIFSPQDISILNYFLQGFSLRKIAEMLNLDRKTVTKAFKRSILFIGLNYDS